MGGTQCRRHRKSPAGHRAVVTEGLDSELAFDLFGAASTACLSYRWHAPAQYELWKLPIDVTLARRTGFSMANKWEYGQRPLPDNARFCELDDIDSREYDLAIATSTRTF